MDAATQFALLFRLVKFRPPTLPEQQVMSHSRQGLKMRSRSRHKMHPTTHGARTLPNSGPPRHHAHSVRSPCMCAARRGCSMGCYTDSACGVLMCPKSVRNYYPTLTLRIMTTKTSPLDGRQHLHERTHLQAWLTWRWNSN